MKRLGYSPWGNTDSIYPFDALFDEKVDAEKHGFDNIDALVLWGGTDIHPSFYGQAHNKFNGAPSLPSTRDLWEWRAMKYCKAHNIPIIGVCRGAQFLCAFAGGALFQHVNGHANGQHMMTTSTGEMFSTTSAHHQMLDLKDVKHELLAWSTENLSRVYYDSEQVTPFRVRGEHAKGTFKEPEVVFFPEIGGLAIQGHPEWASKSSRFVEYCNELITEYLFAEEWAV